MHRVEGRKRLGLDAVNIGTLVFAFLVAIFLNHSSFAQSLEYRTIKDTNLQIEIGLRLFNQPTDGCWSCHGTDAKSLKSRSGDIKAIRLSDPSTWRSHQITKIYDSDDAAQLTQSAIAISLIRLGADDWNRDLAPLIRAKTGTTEIFFDERMIGIHSAYLKKNERAIARMLNRAKIRASRDEILDIMATSVFQYLSDELVVNEN